MQKLLVIQVAALGFELTERFPILGKASGLVFRPFSPSFPAVTCTAQATLRCAAPPARTGVVCNGRFDRIARRTDFWNQSARLVRGERIWSSFRARGGKVGMLFWQQSLGEDLDLLLSPAPIHRHHGGMIEDCYGKPSDLYPRLVAALGRPFRLRSYWGPSASEASSRWIAEATRAVMTAPDLAPDLLMTYLPHLDYTLQKLGPETTRRLERDVNVLADVLRSLVNTAQEQGYDVVVWGDYAITPANKPVFLNRVLRDAGFFDLRHVGRRTYPDLYRSRAFAMADHQLAHIYVRNARDIEPVKKTLTGLPGVADVLPHESIDHPESGECIALAEADAWFAYPWWTEKHEAPDYAAHVDIHNKIGFDPCELFWGLPGISVSLDPSRVKGTHGRNEVPAAFGATMEMPECTELIQLARCIKNAIR